MFVLILFVITVACAYFLLISNYGYWKKRGVPHPPVSTLFGNLGESLVMKKSLGQIYENIYSNYSSLRYVGFYKMRQPGIVLRDPELIKEVLLKSFSSFHDNDVDVNEKADSLLAKTPFFLRGEKWKITRNQITPSFTGKQIKLMFPLTDTVCKNLIKHIEETDPGINGIETKELIAKYTTDVVATCAFGLEANSFIDPNAKFLKMGKKILYPSFFMGLKILLQFVMPSLAGFLNIKFVPDVASEYFRKIINQTLEYRKANNVIRNDFLDLMKEFQNKLGSDSFTNEDITAHALGFFLDGFETSSIVLSFALYELASNPEIQDKLKKEIDVTMTNNDNKLTYDIIQGMSYLDKVVYESLRMHPPVFFLTKLCTETFKFPSPQESGPEVTIEPGTPIIIPVSSLHYDPKYYSDPDRFDPERFSDENKETRVKGTFLPFGEGPRMCLGQRFGMMQVKAALIHLVSRFEVRVNNKTLVPLQIDPTYFLRAVKGGVWLNFNTRKSQ